MSTGPHKRVTARAFPAVDELADTVDEDSGAARRGRVRTPISVPRAETPDDDVLARAVAALRADDPCWGFAHEVKGAVDELRDKVAALEAAGVRKPWRRFVSWAGRLLGAGAVTAALGLTARALIAHGKSTEHAVAREALLDRTVRQVERNDARDVRRDQFLVFLAGSLGLPAPNFNDSKDDSP